MMGRYLKLTSSPKLCSDDLRKGQYMPGALREKPQGHMQATGYGGEVVVPVGNYSELHFII